jgi:uncharacterized protein YfaP (DUF2135 family)
MLIITKLLSDRALPLWNERNVGGNKGCSNEIMAQPVPAKGLIQYPCQYLGMLFQMSIFNAIDNLELLTTIS